MGLARATEIAPEMERLSNRRKVQPEARSFFYLDDLTGIDHNDAMIAAHADLGAVLRGEDGQDDPFGHIAIDGTDDDGIALL